MKVNKQKNTKSNSGEYTRICDREFPFKNPCDYCYRFDCEERTMELSYPYSMKIVGKKMAVNTIMNMCKNCEDRYFCTGKMAYDCNKVKEEIVSFYGG